MNNKIYDLCIVGGGINGTAIAADAAGRGLSVILCEQNDLASGTSSSSTKLIHGGLRYLEYHKFGLVRKALIEREILLKRAPHLIKSLEFILPVESKLRSPYIINIGLFLYDHLSKRSRIPKSKKINLKKETVGKPLHDNYTIGFSYYDCFADDSRLVIANALSAKEHGAEIMPQREVIAAHRENKYWKITIFNKLTQIQKTIQAKVLINSAGPWVDILNSKLGSKAHYQCQLVQGSHIVIKKFYCGEHAYILQNPDKRIIFVIPYLGDYLLIGTTEIEFNGDPTTALISKEEIDYLCKIVNHYFNIAISESDVIWSYSGVRALIANDHNNLSALTRDYKIDCEDIGSITPLLTVFGGKLTTHRELAETVLTKLKPYFPSMPNSWTANLPLPGGNIAEADFSEYLKLIFHRYSWLPKTLALRYSQNYGCLIERLLEHCHSLKDLGFDFGNNLYQIEVEYLIIHEWAYTVEDILWRRTKLGLTATPEMKELLSRFLESVFKNN